jgi:hypothetical protein
MAKETIVGIRINVKGTKETEQRIADISNKLDDVNAELKQLEKAKKGAFGNTAELSKFNQRIAELKVQQASLRAENRAVTKEVNLQAKAFQAVGSQANSLNALRAQLSLIDNELASIDQNTEFGQKLAAEANGLRAEVTKLEQGMGNFTRNVGNYEQSIINALKKAGNEKALTTRLSQLNEETKQLKEESDQLANALGDPNVFGAGSAKEAIEELKRLGKQIAANEKEAKQLQSALDAGAEPGKSDRKVSGRAVKRAGKLAGLGGLADIAGGAVDLQNILGGLGPAGVAAFGVFAAGGLVFKGVQALEQLTAGINKTTAEVQRLSGASVEEAKGLTDEVRTLGIAFGESEETVLEKVKNLQESFGISFPEALAKAKEGYIATAQAGGVLNSTVQNQLDSSAALVAVQRELADRFNETGISTGTLVTDIKTGLLTALITVYDAVKPVIDTFVQFGKSLFGVVGSIGKAAGGASIFTKSLKVLFVPLRTAGAILSAIAQRLANFAEGVVNFINESPNLQAAFKVVGDAVSSFLDFVLAIPDAIGATIQAIFDIQDAVFNFSRDVLSSITGGLIDDAATAKASADARDAGRTISEALVERYGEGVKELSVQTQLAVLKAGDDAFNAAKAAGKTTAEAVQAGIRAADAEARKNNLLAIKKGEAELTEAQLQSQLEAAEKVKAAREKAAADLQKDIEEFNKKRVDSEKDFNKTLEDVRKQSAGESISFIQNDYERQNAEIEAQSAEQIEVITQTLKDANEARQETLRLGAQVLGRGGKVEGFASVDEIKAAAAQAQQATEEAIKTQTAQINTRRIAQIETLRKNREKLIAETVRNIDNEALNRAIEQQQLQQDITSNEIAATQKAADEKTRIVDAQYQRITNTLAVQRADGLLTEKEYNDAISALDRDLAIAKLEIERETQAELSALQQRALQQQLAFLQIQAQQQQRAADDKRAQDVANIQQQAQQGILTEQQAADAIAQINADAEAAKVANAQITNQKIEALNTEFANNELAQAESQAAQELAIQRSLQEAIRAERQATFEQLSQNVQNLNAVFGTVTQVTDDLFAASTNRRTQAIEAQYAREVELANGNQAAIAAAEQRKDQQLQAIEKAAFERKKKFDTSQALINGALAVTNILATTPDPTGLFTAFRIAAAIATTAAQVAKIQSQQFADGGELPAGDKMLSGNSHANGGIKYNVAGKPIELEGGEYLQTDEYGRRIAINKKSSSRFKPLLDLVANQRFRGKRQMLSQINSVGGGVQFAKGGIIPTKRYNTGGVMPISRGFIAQQQAQENQFVIINELARVVAANTNAAISRIKVINDPQETIEQGAKKITQSNSRSL